MKKSAIISPCGQYRYRLTRGEGNLMPVVMLNPSTADADVDDPTIRRLLGFAQREKYDGIDVVNLYAYRATDPAQLHEVGDPYGPDNQRHHLDFARQYGSDIIVAWGSFATKDAVDKFCNTLVLVADPSNLLSCFGHTKTGKPKHPLYLPNDTVLQPYDWYPHH